MGIPMHPIIQLVKIEGAGGCYRLSGLHRGRIIFSNGNPCVQDLGPSTGPTHYRIPEEVHVTIGTSLTDMAVDSFGTLDGTK